MKTRDQLGWQFGYDDADRITTVTDPAGRVISLDYVFDAAKRLRKLVRTRADGVAVTRDLDEQGRPVRMTDPTGTTEYAYDPAGRLVRVARDAAPVVLYEYDALDRITRVQVGAFYNVENAYDFLGRLTSMKTPAGEIQYAYLPGRGEVVRTLPNGIKTIWAYDTSGALLSITHVHFRDPDDASGVVVAQFAYTYRPDGRIASKTEFSGGRKTETS